MNSTKDIKRRINSINNTRKITKAMEMVSATKMRKAISGVLKIRPYAYASWRILNTLAGFSKQDEHPFLKNREVKKELIIIITSNKGLCGSFNSQIAKEIENKINIAKNTEKEFIIIGKKAENIVKKFGHKIVAVFHELSYSPTISSIRPLFKLISADFISKKYDNVSILYTDYVSTLIQKVKFRQILPVSKKELEKQLLELENLTSEEEATDYKLEYIVEPNRVEIIDTILKRFIEMQIYHAILESTASKESARMLAMRNATDAAGEMVEGLTFAYNQLRQTKITQEISEISAGCAALEK